MNKNTLPSSSASDLDKLIGEHRPPRWWRRTSVWAGIGLVLVAAVAWTIWQSRQEASAAPVYVTEALRQGNLTLTVSANGTLQPTRAVNIGSELSGTVKRVLVDVNDRVKVGQVLVELDTAKFNDQVQRSRAALAAAQAQLAQASATVTETRASLARFEEVARLSGGRVPSATELDAARAALERAVANAASASANVGSARAVLATDETNLSKASIRSPIDGVVLSRTVDPGNAVAASLQAVTLFSVAEDLTKLKLEVNVDEADVGAVQAGQRASFTVSAYPSRRYPATTNRVAFGSTKTDNVVTYVTTLDVDNSDLSLRPGMTAAATIVAVERNDVLVLPNAALRYSPTQANAASRPAASGGILGQLMPRMPRSGRPRQAGEERGAVQGERSIWVLRDGQPVEMRVTTGISDGRRTEVSGEGVTEGLLVITDQRSGAGAP
ncbi:MAG: efflux RND transporter periplasmic adaptor subunit [Hydrogenophaga sp.]